MRIIKFRGQNINTLEFVYGDLIHDLLTGSYTILTRYDGFIEVIPESVGQFTGLKDKNKVEIYDGDFIQSNKSKYKRFNKNGIYEVYFNEFLCHYALVDSSVEWNNKHGAYDDYSLTGAKTKDFVVIGNIHERKK